MSLVHHPVLYNKCDLNNKQMLLPYFSCGRLSGMTYEEIETLMQKALSKSVQISPTDKSLLSHEKELLKHDALQNITHRGSSSIWLEAKCSVPVHTDLCNVYRPMGDVEVVYLMEHGVLPDTQPYQAIMQGPAGRVYADKYLNG